MHLNKTRLNKENSYFTSIILGSGIVSFEYTSSKCIGGTFLWTVNTETIYSNEHINI